MADESDRLTRSESGTLERVRATPLKPAVWMTGVLVWATVVGLFLRVPTWGAVFLCSLTGISFLFYLVSYIYLHGGRSRQVAQRAVPRASGRARTTSGGTAHRRRATG